MQECCRIQLDDFRPPPSEAHCHSLGFLGPLLELLLDAFVELIELPVILQLDLLSFSQQWLKLVAFALFVEMSREDLSSEFIPCQTVSFLKLFPD